MTGATTISVSVQRPTILFLHQNFPGQFRHLATALANDEHYKVVALSIGGSEIDADIEHHLYDPISGLTDGQKPPSHPWLVDAQFKMIRARAVQGRLQQLQADGLMPDLVIGHSGWGDMLGLREVLPITPILGYPEFFSYLNGADGNFDPEFPITDQDHIGSLLGRQALQLLDLEQIDWGLVPTWWQWSLMPKPYQNRFSVIHEGVDCHKITPRANSRVKLNETGLYFQAGDELVTFISRDLEPYRGFHTFMRSLPLLLRRRPHAHVLIVGGTGTSYGRRPPEKFNSWKEYLLHHLGPLLDPNRIHFLPRVPHPVLHEVMRVSAAHVYLTVPFVLSWSLLEAMACATPIVASNTEPVREVIRDGIEGRLVNMLDPQELARVIIEVLENPEKHRQMGANARRHVQQHYDLHSICLPQQLALVETLLQGFEPAPPQPPPGIERALFQPPPPRLKPRPAGPYS